MHIISHVDYPVMKPRLSFRQKFARTLAMLGGGPRAPTLSDGEILLSNSASEPSSPDHTQAVSFHIFNASDITDHMQKLTSSLTSSLVSESETDTVLPDLTTQTPVDIAHCPSPMTGSKPAIEVGPMIGSKTDEVFFVFNFVVTMVTGITNPGYSSLTLDQLLLLISTTTMLLLLLLTTTTTTYYFLLLLLLTYYYLLLLPNTLVPSYPRTLIPRLLTPLYPHTPAFNTLVPSYPGF